MSDHGRFIKELRDSGYIVEVARNAHYKVRRPNGSYLMTMSVSPSDRNATRQARKLAIRLGVVLENK